MRPPRKKRRELLTEPWSTPTMRGQEREKDPARETEKCPEM